MQYRTVKGLGLFAVRFLFEEIFAENKEKRRRNMCIFQGVLTQLSAKFAEKDFRNMLEEYIYHGAKKLRCGYTTGSCAAGAAKAAAQMLLSGGNVTSISLETPKGITLELEILNAEFSGEYARCAVQKDGGDDIDATDGILVYAGVSKRANGVEITGGEGIGKVTKPGLDRAVGDWAINSAPREMITKALSEAAEKHGYKGGFHVEISVPNGAEIAQKTYNPHMGIEGGISIIGTTGIVEPMSNTALVETIRAEAKMRRAEGVEHLLITLGNYSERYVTEQFPFSLESGVKCSNFIGEALDIALELGFKSALIVGHIGKLVKLGAGIMNTHSSQADGRMDVLVTCGLLAGVNPELLKKLPECVTVDAALEILKEDDLEKTLETLAKRAEHYLNARVRNTLPVGAVMFSDKHNISVRTKSANDIIRKISEEQNG